MCGCGARYNGLGIPLVGIKPTTSGLTSAGALIIELERMNSHRAPHKEQLLICREEQQQGKEKKQKKSKGERDMGVGKQRQVVD